MKNFLTSVLLFVGITCAAQSYSRNDFSLIAIPPDTSKAAENLYLSGKSFGVSIKTNQLVISKLKSSIISICRVKSGKILAVDMGEWGGGVYFEPADPALANCTVDGKKVNFNSNLKRNLGFAAPNDSSKSLLGEVQALVAPGSCEEIVSYKQDWLFIQGSNIGHMNNWLSKLEMQHDSFKVIKLVSFDAMPRAMAFHNGNIYVVTQSGFYKISPRFKVEVQMTGLFQPGLKPNSIAVLSDREIYLGTISGYYQLDCYNKKLSFFAYRNVNQ